MVGNLPTFNSAAKIERRAQRISDPIERLRYLRSAAVSSTRSSTTARWPASLVLMMAVLPMGSDALNREPVSRGKMPLAIHQQAADVPNVWPVEHTTEYDLYSNGLRVENRLQVSNQPRSYSPIARGSGALGPVHWQPAGIVYHTTESDQAPFESQQRSTLKRIGQEVLLYVRNKRAYHFVIDRFGRVHRIVAESETANHAGHSVWADAQWSYVDLNASFLGVAFEASMLAGEQPISEAQMRAGRALTEMLRAKYNLAAVNCITHAQVSVNPENMRIGWHTDWGGKFPFQEMGLPNNYEIPSPSLYLFGFQYDPAYVNSTGPDVWKGLALAEERVRETAAEHGETVSEYRRTLRQRYRDALSALQTRADEESQNEK